MMHTNWFAEASFGLEEKEAGDYVKWRLINPLGSRAEYVLILKSYSTKYVSLYSRTKKILYTPQIIIT